MAKDFDGAILHFGAVRFRVNGSGNLQSTLQSLDTVFTDPQAPIAMQAATDVEPLVLANFSSQRAQLHMYVNNIDEIFTITRITIFAKQLFTGYPQ